MARGDARTLHPVFRCVVSTVVPEAKTLNADEWRELDELVVESLRLRPPSLQQRLQAFMRLVQWLPVVRYGRRFTALDDGRRTRFLAALQSSPVGLLRLGFWGLRTLALLGYYGRESAARSIGYSPEARGWEAVR